MTASSDDKVKPAAEAARSPHLSHHKARHRKRIALKIVLILALGIGGLAIVHFAYNAFVRAECLPEESDILGIKMPAAMTAEDCRGAAVERDELMRWDAAAALLAVTLAVWSTAASRKLKKHRR